MIQLLSRHLPIIMRLFSMLICALLIGTWASLAKVNDGEAGRRRKSGKLLSLFNFVSFPVSIFMRHMSRVRKRSGMGSKSVMDRLETVC